MASRILEPGEIERLAPDPIARLRLPAADRVFGERAQRLLALAPASALGDYLRFMAQLAQQQQRVCPLLDATPIPDPQRLAHCREHAMPPLAASHWRRDPKWRLALHSAMQALRDVAGPAPAAQLARLLAMGDDFLEAQASKICAGIVDGLDLALAPLIAAALQAYWTSMAARLGADAVGVGAAPGLCPVCGFAPVASVVRIGGAEAGYRYLQCGLCASQWQMVRVKCSRCDSTKGISYHVVEGGNPAVKAEACAACGTYLKILYMEKDPGLEPAADDLASLALDLLMTEESVARSGVNLMLFHAPA